MPPGKPLKAFPRLAAIAGQPDVMPEICKYKEADEVTIKGTVDFEGGLNETEITTPIKAIIEDVIEADKPNQNCTYTVKITESGSLHQGKTIRSLSQEKIVGKATSPTNPTKCSFAKDQKVIINGDIRFPKKQHEVEVEDLNAIVLGEAPKRDGKCVYKVRLISDLDEFRDKEATAEEEFLTLAPPGKPTPGKQTPGKPKPIAGKCTFSAQDKAILTGSIKINTEEDDATFDTEVKFTKEEVTILKATPVSSGQPNAPCYYQVQINSGVHQDRKSEDAVPQTMLAATVAKTDAHKIDAENADNADNTANTAVKAAKAVEAVEAVTATPVKKRTVFKRAKVSSLDELNTGGPTGRELIHLAGQKYYIDYDQAARKRRAEIFDHAPSMKQLTDDETKLLESIGVVDDVRESLKPYLYDFFSMLPSCQSSAQMLTNRKCEASYYIMWSVLLKARQNTQRAIDSSKKASLSDTETRMLSAGVDAMAGIPKKKDDLLDEDKTGIMRMIQQIEASITEIKSTLASAKDRNKK